MTEFRQTCPSCNRILALPVTAMGRLAQCPACQETFSAGEQTQTVNQPGQPETGLPADSAADSNHDGRPVETATEPTEQVPQVPETATGPLNQPGESLQAEGDLSATSPTTTRPIGSDFDPTIPAQTDSGQHVAESADESPAQYPEGVNPFSIPLSQNSVHSSLENPYLSSFSSDLSSGNFARRSEVRIVKRSIGEILRMTGVLLVDRGMTQLVSFLSIAFVIGAIAFFAMVFLGLNQFSFWWTNPNRSNFGLHTVAWIVGIPLSTLIVVVSCRSSIAIVRNTPNLTSASMPTYKTMLHAAVPFILMIVIAVTVRQTLFGDYLLDAFVLILTFLCTAFTWGWLWISLFLCCDKQSSGFGSLLLSLRILYYNKLTTAMLIVISSLLAICGIVSCGILLLITQPVTQMLLATAYLMMTNQQIDDPRDPMELFESNS